MAPEILSGKNTASDPAMDIWSMGIILFAMLFGKYPFNSEDAVMNAPLMFPPDKLISNEAQQLLGQLMHKDPAQRIKLHDLVNHSWFFIPDEGLQELMKRQQEEKDTAANQEAQMEALLKKIKEQKNFIQQISYQAQAYFYRQKDFGSTRVQSSKEV
eukprot:TRINITY_DN12407_c0_g2_i1.p1 TRINITY_DN12407_c0_g2~~TRINITY_DN12407_c0_g2_i1.p1  ORF type:complete len:165 (+),score=8.98 TRINITY_DN12407_c0_g2_i1:25-495(+)